MIIYIYYYYYSISKVLDKKSWCTTKLDFSRVKTLNYDELNRIERGPSMPVICD